MLYTPPVTPRKPCSNREISFRSETISEEDPVTQFKFDAGQPVGYFNTEQSAHKGVTARLWKTVTVDGTVQSDEVLSLIHI